jgi:hypothetical protein
MILNYYHSLWYQQNADAHTTIDQWCHHVARQPLHRAEFLVHRVDFLPQFFARLLLDGQLVSEGCKRPGVASG